MLGGGGRGAPDQLKVKGRGEDVLTGFVTRVSPETVCHQFERNVNADVGKTPVRHRNRAKKKKKIPECHHFTFQNASIKT